HVLVPCVLSRRPSAHLRVPPFPYTTLFRSDSGARPGGGSPPLPRRGPASAPAVVRERPVRLGHLVGVLTALDRGAQAVRGVQDLVGETLDHRVLTTLTGEGHQPAQCEGGGPAGPDLDRDLVRGAADAAGPHLECGPHVVQALLEGDDRVGAGLLAADLHRRVHDPLGGGLLAVDEDLVDELRDQRRPVDRVVDQLALRGWALTRHYFSFFAP